MTEMTETPQIERLRGMNYVEADDPAPFLVDDSWCAQQKMDGVRVILDGRDHTITGRNGEEITFAAARQWFGQLAERFVDGHVVEGELMIETGDFFAFDVLSLHRPMRERFEWLGDRFYAENLVPTAWTLAGKHELWRWVMLHNAEGLVFKWQPGFYVHGRRSSDVVKVKLTRTVDAVVLDVSADPLSAQIGVYDTGDALVAVGRISLRGKGPVEVGEVVEVKYLYRTEADTLYQARMLRKREDKLAVDCRFDQLPAVRSRAPYVGAAQ